MFEGIQANIVRARRRSVSIQIKEDSSVHVRAPHRIPLSYIQDLMRKKQAWILGKQALMEERRKQKEALAAPGRETIKFHKAQAKKLIPQRVEYYSTLYGINYRQIKITSARRRFGSCNHLGNLNFTWRLVKAPLEVIDYVVIHELAHIEVRNHSQIFWKKVETLYPNYRACRKWLRERGHLL